MQIERFAFRTKDLAGIALSWLFFFFRMWLREQTAEADYAFNYENFMANIPKISSALLIYITFNLTLIFIRDVALYFGPTMPLKIIKMQNKFRLIQLLCALNPKNNPKFLQYFVENSDSNMRYIYIYI